MLSWKMHYCGGICLYVIPQNLFITYYYKEQGVKRQWKKTEYVPLNLARVYE